MFICRNIEGAHA